MRYKIGFIGEKDAVYAFGMLGMDVNYVNEASEVRSMIHEMVQQEYGVIFITEALAAQVPHVISEYDEQFLPAIILIPSEVDSESIGMQRIQEKVKKAVGQNIL